jgi:hypothetical protein
LSLGGADGWIESTSSVVASRLSDSGIIVTISNGNDVRGFYFSQTLPYYIPRVHPVLGIQPALQLESVLSPWQA